MDKAEAETRARIVTEAKSWINTPYHHHGRVKGVGVDCAQILIAVYSEAGFIPKFDPGHYPPDWHLHHDDERYLSFVLPYVREMEEEEARLPGDLMLIKYGRAFAHSAIIIEWPLCIHALMRSPVCYTNPEQDAAFREYGNTGKKLRPRRFFSMRKSEA